MLLPKIPDRPSHALTGSEFIANLLTVQHNTGADAAREDIYLQEFLSGNVPDFLREFTSVQIGEHTICVSRDYLSIGTDEDFVRVPMNPLTAQKIMDAWGCCLPTKLMVDSIFAEADIRVPFPAMTPPKYPYDSSMMSTSRFAKHNEMIQKLLPATWLGKLVAGHKKDIIIDSGEEKRGYTHVGVYGAFDSLGRPIHNFRTDNPQKLYRHSHEVTYKDYSHGVRAVHAWASLMDGSLVKVQDELRSSTRFQALSYDGPHQHTRYPV